MSVVIPQIPDVPHGQPMVIFSFLSRIKEAIDVMAGRRGTKRNRAVTFQDLIDMKIIDTDYNKVT